MRIDNRPTYNLLDYTPYATMFHSLMLWSYKTRPELVRKDREDFVRNIIQKKHSNLIEGAWEEWHKLEQKIIENKRKIYESYGKERYKYLAGACVGECFLFISHAGDEHYLKCVGEKECQGYDYNEWCVADRDYTYRVPIFEDPNGKRCSYTGLAVLVSEEEFLNAKKV